MSIPSHVGNSGPIVICPTCQARLQAPVEAVGRKVVCPGCGAHVAVPVDAERPVHNEFTPIFQVEEPSSISLITPRPRNRPAGWYVPWVLLGVVGIAVGGFAIGLGLRTPMEPEPQPEAEPPPQVIVEETVSAEPELPEPAHPPRVRETRHPVPPDVERVVKEDEAEIEEDAARAFETESAFDRPPDGVRSYREYSERRRDRSFENPPHARETRRRPAPQPKEADPAFRDTPGP